MDVTFSLRCKPSQGSPSMIGIPFMRLFLFICLFCKLIHIQFQILIPTFLGPSHWTLCSPAEILLPKQMQNLECILGHSDHFGNIAKRMTYRITRKAYFKWEKEGNVIVPFYSHALLSLTLVLSQHCPSHCQLPKMSMSQHDWVTPLPPPDQLPARANGIYLIGILHEGHEEIKSFIFLVPILVWCVLLRHNLLQGPNRNWESRFIQTWEIVIHH